MKPRNLPKENIRNVRVVDLEIILHFILEYGISILSKVGCVCEAARVERPRRLLKGPRTGRARWVRCWWCDIRREGTFCK